jgi:hypothetical protein
MFGNNKMKACNEIGNITRAGPDVWVYETLTDWTKNFIPFLAKVACFGLGKPNYGFHCFEVVRSHYFFNCPVLIFHLSKLR